MKRKRFSSKNAEKEAGERQYQGVGDWAEDQGYVYCSNCDCYVLMENATVYGNDNEWTCNSCELGVSESSADRSVQRRTANRAIERRLGASQNGTPTIQGIQSGKQMGNI